MTPQQLEKVGHQLKQALNVTQLMQNIDKVQAMFPKQPEEKQESLALASSKGSPDSAAEVQKKAHAESMKATENVVKKEEEDAYTIDNIMKYQEQVDEMHAHVASSAPVPKKPVDIGETNAAVQRAAHEIYEDSGMPDIVVTSLENSDESTKFHMSSEAKHFIKDLGQKQRAEKA